MSERKKERENYHRQTKLLLHAIKQKSVNKLPY